jgi:hypothetical protein
MLSSPSLVVLRRVLKPLSGPERTDHRDASSGRDRRRLTGALEGALCGIRGADG